MQLKIDLTEYRCPQLFVQFKFQLKHAEKKRQPVCFIYEKKQLIEDILAFLDNKQFVYTHYQDAKPFPFIEVNF